MERTAINRIDLTAAEEQVLYTVLRQLLNSVTKNGSGKRVTENLRFELEEDQYESLMMVFAQL